MKPQDRINAILSAPCLDAQAIVVAIAIATHLNDDDDWCWPSIARLEGMTKLSDRTIQGVIAWASAPEVGWLSLDERPGQMRKLRIDWDQLSCKDIPARTTGARKSNPRSGLTPEAGSPPNGARLPPNGARQTPERGSPEPTSEPTMNRPLGREGASAGATPSRPNLSTLPEPIDPRLSQAVGIRPDLLRLLLVPLDPADPPIADLDTLRRTSMDDLQHRKGMGPKRAKQLAQLLADADVPLIAERPAGTGPPARASPTEDRRARGLKILAEARQRLATGAHNAFP